MFPMKTLCSTSQFVSWDARPIGRWKLCTVKQKREEKHWIATVETKRRSFQDRYNLLSVVICALKRDKQYEPRLRSPGRFSQSPEVVAACNRVSRYHLCRSALFSNSFLPAVTVRLRKLFKGSTRFVWTKLLNSFIHFPGVMNQLNFAKTTDEGEERKLPF